MSSNATENLAELNIFKALLSFNFHAELFLLLPPAGCCNNPISFIFPSPDTAILKDRENFNKFVYHG